MKSIILPLVLVLVTSSFAYDKDDILKDYADKKYKKICLESAYFYKNGGKDENLLSLIGDSCVKSDYINPLGYIVKNLISSPQARQNASYFSTILLQKKLIYQFINDGLNLKNLRLPKTEHVLSVVFENLVKDNYSLKEDIFTINYDKNQTIILYKKVKNDKNWVVIEEHNDGELKIRHWYI